MIARLAKQTLSGRLRSNLVWAASLLVWSVIIVAIFPTVAKADFSRLLENYPKEVLAALGIEDVTSFNTPIGYLNAELFSLVFPLTVVFLPLTVISRSLPAAEERHYLDVLLSAPISRWHVVAAAATAAAVSLGAVLLALWGGTLVAAELLGVDLGAAELARSCAALFPLATLIASVGLLVAGAHGGRGATLGVAGAVLVVMYMLPVVATFVASLEGLKWLSVFHYYNGWINGGIDWLQFAAMIATGFAMTVLAAVLFTRRDIAS